MFPTTVAMDLESVFEPAQAYVMLSRIQCLDQLFIVDKLNEKRLNASIEAHAELRRLETISFNKVPTPWHDNVAKSMKIATLNCAGILPHFRDIVKDNKLLKGHLINLLETSLPSDCDVSEISIHGFKGHFVNVGNGKGVATFVHDDFGDFFYTSVNVKTLQIALTEFDAIDVISVYRYFNLKALFKFELLLFRSSSHSLGETWESLEPYLRRRKPILLTGDFNVCFKTNQK